MTACVFLLSNTAINRTCSITTGADPGRRTQPHWPGHRVRLLLLPCVVLAQVKIHPRCTLPATQCLLAVSSANFDAFLLIMSTSYFGWNSY